MNHSILFYKESGSGEVLVILHGLFGSLDNWQTLAKNWSEKYRVINTDMRNHGRSFHAEEMNFEEMNGDLLNLIEHIGVDKINLLGHSMGGKMAMNFACTYPTLIKKLIVVDVAPYEYPHHHNDVFDALFAARVEHAESRADIEMNIQKHISNPMVVQFLMKGVQRNESGSFQWKFNLNSLYQNYNELIGHIPSGRFDGDTLFIKGAESDYISFEKIEHIPVLFPHYQIESIKNAGHWVHADNPIDFSAAVLQFLNATY